MVNNTMLNFSVSKGRGRGRAKSVDGDQPDKRTEARRLFRESKPLFLIGPPMCTARCTWQKMNKLKRDPTVVQRELVRARLHFDVAIGLCHGQPAAGRYFLHGQPRTAASWEGPMVENLAQMLVVRVVIADRCQFGAEVPSGTDQGQPVHEATGFMSNALGLVRCLAGGVTDKGGAAGAKEDST